MAKTATLSIRIEADAKSRAEKLFAKLGMSMTQAVNMFIHQSIIDHALPFQPHLDRPEIPNDETIAAMEEIERRIVEEKAGTYTPKGFATVEELFADLES